MAEEKLREYLKRATGELQAANHRLRELEQRDREPVAIVGMSCRFPGGATSPQRLWELLAAGGDGIVEFPADRGWDLERLYDPDPDRPGASYTRHGGLMPEVAEFDPGFFGIGPREALAMDPQQRLLLEGSWEALEDAGIDPRSLAGTKAGVFTGIAFQDYSAGAGSGSPELEGYLSTGRPTSVVSGRIAYTLGLEGPALTVDTACSSSLVAMHLAIQALHSRECDVALAGGATVMATPTLFVETSRQRALAPDGRSKSFAAAADGAGFSEGAGLVLLERLSDAQRNGRRILALVRGSAMNQDGASNGLTAPNGPSQERVIRQALANAGLTPAEVDAVEAHGTGTALGDPIEAQALLATYGQERGEAGPLALGSLKSNVGHTQAAAGVGGVIKMVLALRNETLPRTLHVDEPTPHVDWERGEVELLTEQREWPKGGRPRRAGISSFGISGTNAHLIVEEAPEREAPERSREARPPAIPWALSAKSPEALRDAAGRLAAHVESAGPDGLDVARTLLEARARLEHRAVVVGADDDELLAGLDALAGGRAAPNLASARAGSRRKIAFVFPGQGSQWAGMARQLLAESALFADWVGRCERALAPHLEFSVRDVLAAAEGAPSLERIEVVQPALFATMVSLAELWRAHGVKPAAVVGHSQGEIAAAVIAGALSLEDGAMLAARRSATISKLVGKGAMVSVALPAERARELIEPFGEQVALAAVNGPAAVTLACGEPALAELLALCEAEDIRARAVAATIPSHSHHVDSLREEVLETLAAVEPHEAEVPFYSTIAAAPLTGAELDAGYWFRNLREPVEFQRTVERLLDDGFATFVEISSHPVLAMAAQETAEARGREDAAVLHTLRREEGGIARFMQSLGQAYAEGVEADFAPLLAGSGAAIVDLPTYPFQRERYWVDSGQGGVDLGAAGQAAADHPLLGASISLAAESSHLLTGRVSLRTHPWLADHAVAGTPILPGTAFAELALRAGREVGCRQLEELVLEAPLILPEDGALQLQVAVAADEEERQRLQIHSRPEPGDGDPGDGEEPAWTRHASGTLTAAEPPAFDFDAAAWPPPGAEPLDAADFYDLATGIGIEYGPAFQGLEAAWRLGGELFAEVSLAEEQEGEAGRFGLHPALFDAAFHAAMLGAEGAEGLGLPFRFGDVRLYGGAGAKALRVRVSAAGERLRLRAADADGTPVVAVDSVAVRPLDPAQLGAASRGRDALFAIEWRPVELPDRPAAGLEVSRDRDELLAAFGADRAAADTPAVFAHAPEPAAGEPAAAARAATAASLELLQAFLAEERLAGSRLAFVTEGAMAATATESPDPALAALWGLVRSAQSEHPGRFLLVDMDGSEASAAALAAALALDGEPQLALRGGAASAPRLAPAGGEDELAPPAGEAWCLRAGEGGTLDELRPGPSEDATRPLGEGEVRVRVHAAGVNFRDVLVTLGLGAGMGAEPIGSEGAGTVLEVGAGVGDLRPGDRVFGYLGGAFGPVATGDRHNLAPLPREWSFVEGAAASIVFCTALYGLGDLADLQAGERVLVHAGAGGVGMAAIQVARHRGAEVFATASPAKWEALRALGLDDDHIASSRDLEFREKFLATTGGEGVDVVLNSLAREFVDASLELLPRGGRFLEMGKTDLRDPAAVAADRPGVAYLPYSLGEAGPERAREMLGEMVALFEAGALAHLPVTTWSVLRAPEAFRHLSQGRHVGKVVLTVPRPPDPEGTVLLTGGLSGLGALTARHLAERHGARHLLLASRRGPDAPGAGELVAELAELGCAAEAVACDAADREQLGAAIAAIPAEHPLTAVVHSAAVLDDATIESLEPGQLDGVFAAKVDAAWNLHELTRELDLAELVLYSSAASTFGSPGQGNYAAANAFLDALAQWRRAEGLPATAIAWGMWERETEATAAMGEADAARLRRGGVLPLSTERGLELLDRGRAGAAPLAVAIPFDPTVLRGIARAGVLPPLLSGLVEVRGRRARAAAGSLARRLAGVAAAEREPVVLALVREHAAAVLGHSSAAAIEAGANFKQLGFDSLGAVELRNRLAQATGVRLEATLVFDRPTPAAVAAYLLEQVEGTGGGAAAVAARGSEEPIAIVGAACRFPGGVSSPAQLWELLAAGRDGISGFPADRGWNLEALYDPDPAGRGTSYSRHGGFLAEAGDFDPAFFGIGPHEALAMDPQQRLLLEGAWEALEDAGIDPTSLGGSPTGTFVGISSQDYVSQGSADRSPAELEGLLVTGLMTSVASGRIAYTLGLEGPAVTIDTACSSSLVAMHLAAQALRAGECGLALAGGATVLATPSGFAEMSRQRVLSPDGRCRSFAGAADGTGFSEGMGLLALERLSDAKRNGRRILAVVRGSATNQDGASNGLTAPSGPSQERVIRQALANAGLTPAEVDAVEAHGTGTVLGDPIEAQALLATYGQERGEAGPLLLGSLKSNLGHTQAAAGVGGVIKMAMALRNEALPQTLHVDEPTPHVDWEAGEVELLTEQREWPQGERPRRVGVSSFGISGTNAHVILEEAPELEEAEKQEAERPPVIPWALSAKSPEALREAAGRLAAHVEARAATGADGEDLDPLDVAQTLLSARALLDRRAVVVGADRDELLEGLDALAQGKPAANLATGHKNLGPIAFLLSGQGSQRPEMGKGLYEAFPVYAEAFDAACEALEAELGTSVKDAVFAGPDSELAESLDRTDLTQAALFALQVALFRLVSSFGASPDYLLGHSIGEISAAHLAGVLSLEDAAKLVAARGRLMAALPEGGAMASIRATEQEVEESLASYEGKLTIAAINGPSSVTVSGDEDALAEWEATQGERKVTRLRTSHAFHSHRMEPMLEEFEELAATLTFSAPSIPVISNRSGEPLSEEQATSPAYWAAHVREAVRFADGVAYLNEQGTTSYLELGPDSTLTALAIETLEAPSAEAEGEASPRPAPTLATALRRERDDAEAFLTGLGTLHAGGSPVDFAPLLKGTGATTVDLPTYPFQRRRFWLEAGAAAGDASSLGQSATDHPLLGAALSLAREGETVLTGRVSLRTHQWLAGHSVGGTPILPGTAFVEIALRAGREVGAAHLEELVLEAPLALPEEGAVQLQVTLSSEDGDEDRHRLEIHSRPEPGGTDSGTADEEEDEERSWTRHASGTLAAGAPPAFDFAAAAWPPPGAEPLSTEDFYDSAAEAGLEYGPAFQGLEVAWRLGDDVFAEVSLPAEQSAEAERFGVHPALLDAAFHAAFLEVADGERPGGIRLPFSFAGVSTHEGDAARGATAASALRVRIGRRDERISLEAVDGDGAPVVAVAGLAVRPLAATELATPASRGLDPIFKLGWTELELPTAAGSRAEVFECPAEEGLEPAAAALALTAAALERLQAFLADASRADSRLAFLTRGAVAVEPGESADPAQAAVWGLVRSAQSEHPGRFLLIDSDGSAGSKQALTAALAIEEEPQIALRAGSAHAPRLAEAGEGTGAEPLPLDRDGTVLVTGGLSGLGALTARHLAERHGAKHLLLASRRGPEAPGAAELVAELATLGCEATAVACDAADRDQLAALLAAIPAERPLTAVVHSAVVLDDGVVERLDPERLARVLAPKADAAWNLHELTREVELAEFVLYSSAAAVYGSPGQANYAAANAFLDALAQRRRAEGLPATAIAWGMWERETEATAGMGDADVARLKRGGAVAISTEQGLAILDRARSLPEQPAVAAPLDASTLRTLARAGMLPPLLDGLVRVRTRRAGGGSLARRLAAVEVGERQAVVLALVREHTAAILGRASAGAVDSAASFKDLGFDSLAAVELRNRLAQATGMRLDATLVFDHPTPEAVAAYLLERAAGTAGGTRVAVAARGSEEPVAIVGMSCRLPGGASSPRELWRLLAAGGEGIAEFPADRGWDVEALYDPDPARPGTSYSRHGGFLPDAGDFDPAFFGISPREAIATDPQQRLLLEGTWEALEDAGIDAVSLRRSRTGVFAGVMSHDYAVVAGAARIPSELEGFLAAGLSGSVASGRVAYTLGLEGPAVTIDTACSSSLVALHLAAQALRAGECDFALAGGATVMATPGLFVEMSRQRGISPDGRCKSFAGAADGVGWSEGAGLLALERLSDARRNGRRVLAVIKGSATNQDGASNGLAAPNGPSQERVILQALANAGLTPAEVDAVEAHGTGTVLGDPIEAQALLATYGQERGENGPLLLGSLKSNLGHTQAAAGVGGVIKMVMALREEALPRTLHVDEPSPHVDWEAGEVELLTEQRPWPKGERPRRVGVSSFGISGTNAHVILEEAPELQPAPEPTEGRPPVIPWALSAKSPEALREAAGRLAAHVEAAAADGEDLDPLDVARTLLSARALLDRRAVVVGADTGELLAGLDALVQGKPAANLTTGRKNLGPTAFLLSGQGSQRAQMGVGLYKAFPVYAEAFDAACASLESELGFSVKDAVFAEPDSEPAKSLERTDLTQASLFALQVALFKLLASFGVTPDYLLGHSIGEISAAHLAGVLSLEDAAKLVAARGKLMAALPEGGAMASIRASEAEVEESLAAYEGKLTVAAINGPASITVSGDEGALGQWQAEQEKQERKVTRLRTSHAFHSHRMEPMLAEFEELASTLTFSAPQIPVISNRTGEPLSEEQATSPAYWAAHVREAVRFADGVAHLNEQGTASYLELGPDTTLTALAIETLEARSGEGEASSLPAPTLATSLRRERDDAEAFLTGLGTLHTGGSPVDLEPLLEGTGATTVDLPTYPFQRRRYWLEVGAGRGDASSLGQGAADHPLLGAVLSLAREGETLFTGRVSLASQPWLADHAVGGTAILPGTAFVEMALRAGREVGADRLEELVLEAPLVLPEHGAVQLQLALSAEDGGRQRIAIHSRPEPTGAADPEGEEEPAWIRHASGSLGDAGPAAFDFDAAAWPPPGAEPIAAEDFYDLVAEAGLEYGPAFQGLGAAWRRGEEVFAEVSLAEEQAAEAERFGLHPALLDAALHGAFVDADPADGLKLPFSWGDVALHGGPRPTALRVRILAGEDRIALAAADSDGVPVVSVGTLSARPLDPAAIGAAAEPERLFDLEWSELTLPEPRPAAGEQAEADGEEAGIELFELASPEQSADPAAAAHDLTAQALERLQAEIAKEGDSRLAVLTNGAVAAAPGESPDPGLAAVWGLVRSAQSEHPGRFLLIDSDDSEASRGALAAALANEEEPQIALRAGTASVPRLAAAAAAPAPAPAPAALDPAGTVLVVGGLAALGATTARHLVAAHSARRLLLVGRRGPETPGAEELVAELAELGCEATAVACDVADRDQLAALLDSIPSAHPLTAVVHCAGALDDGVVDALDRERLDRVLAPKVDGAWNLHELTREMGLADFVLYSSAAATLGTPGQGNYAAANAFMDALAQRRRAEGLPATSVAWGLWEAEGAMAAELSEADRARVARSGGVALTAEQGLELLDRARAGSAGLAVAIALDKPVLRRLARAGMLPSVLRGLVPAGRRRARTPAESLAVRLASVPEAEREAFVLALVREHVAAVLGHASGDAVDPQAAFKDLGFDSLGAVELRNRLTEATGIRLAATLVFDYPTAAAVAGHLLAEAGSGGPEAAADAEEAEVRRLLASIPVDRLRQSGLLEMLEALAGDGPAQANGAEGESAIDSMDIDSLVRQALEGGEGEQ